MNEKEEEQKTAEGVGAGIQPQATDLIKQATEAREGLARENERLEKNIKELQEFRAREILGGQTNAGSMRKDPKEITKEEHLERWKGKEMSPFKGRGAIVLNED